MSILTLNLYAIADIHSPDAFFMPEIDRNQYDGVVTLGDIDQQTLDYILHMGRDVTSFGIPGNHDVAEPAGLNDLHLKVLTINGIRIGGFGGARKYKDHPHHYTEFQVNRMMRRMPPVDLFISHAPPLCVSEKLDPIHRGFAAFDRYLHAVKPCYWLHGHIAKRQRTTIGNTTVISVNQREPLRLTFQASRIAARGKEISQPAFASFSSILQTFLSNFF